MKICNKFFLLFVIFIMFFSQSFLLSEKKYKFVASYLPSNVNLINKPNCIWYQELDAIVQHFKILDSNFMNHRLYHPYPSDVTSFTFDGLNSVWVGTNIGLYSNSGKVTDNSGNSIGDSIYYIKADINNNLWITNNFGIWERKDNKLTNVFPVSTSEIKSKINFIEIDSLNNKWFVSEKGIYKYDDVKIQYYDSTNSPLPSNTVFKIKTDKTNNKWICTNKGLIKFDGVNWELISTELTPIYNKRVTCVDFDSSGNAFIGVQKGMFKLTKNSNWEIVDTAFISYCDVGNIMIDESDNIWFGNLVWNPDSYQIETRLWVYNPNGVNFVGVNENDNFNQLNVNLIYPNPVTSSFSLTEIPEGAYSYEVFDNLGIKRIEGFLGKEIDVSFLPSGLYFLKLNNQTKPIKFIKI